MKLIERDDFLDLLHSGFQKIASGKEGHCFFILGEPGMGKTSLVKTFLTEIEDEGVQYTGACDSLFTPRPLAPLYDLALQIKGDWARKIESIVSRTELFTRFAQELTNKEMPVVLVFEDIHWADEATLDFVKFFARRIRLTNCLFILTCRDDEVSQQHSLVNVLGDLPPDTFTRIQLMPLSRQAVSKLADEKGYDAENVYSVSGGNPFYVNEILASYSPGVPDNVKDAILSVYNKQEEGTKNAWQLFSIIPEGLEINRFSKIKSSWDEGIDHCFALKIIIIKKDKIIFKHELYRRTIENSLSPFKRIALNKKLLDTFLTSFEEEGEIERILHYAKNANENALVVKYAPLAAKQAACVGAHIEASKLFLTAIEYSDGKDKDHLVELYEAYAYECYLINQIKDAIIYQGKALKIWQEKKEIEQTGNSMRFLSRLWWFDGNHREAEKYGNQAIEILQDKPASKAQAMAYSNMSQLKSAMDQSDECLFWGEKAMAVAKEVGDEETLAHALNNMGSALVLNQSSKQKGIALLQQSLEIALKNSYHEHVARFYSTLGTNGVTIKDYAFAKKMLEEGIQYCEERDIDSLKLYMLASKARLGLETGKWDEAYSITNNLLKKENLPPVIKIGALTVLATIKMRRGKRDALPLLLEAKTKAFETNELQRIIPVFLSLLEYEWITGESYIETEVLSGAIERMVKLEKFSKKSRFHFWLKKVGKEYLLPTGENEDKSVSGVPFRLDASFWEKLGCPYEQALTLVEGNEDDKREALLIIQQLGGDAVYEKIKMEMRAVGIKKIPRGMRLSTKTNPAQLTNRELDVLQLLHKAVQNKEIAQTLFISPKTVDHHISSILFKLDVNTRAKAVSEAVRLGILK